MATIDIKGFNGKNGHDGRHGVGYGECGQNAGPAEAGGPGGVAYLRLSRVPDRPSAMQIVGSVNNQPYNQTLDFGPAGLLMIDARGGAGGHGGHGGDGSNGAPGVNGMNATQYSCGTNGGPGGSGGNGGNATSGAGGGNGGFV
jgi:hypothetical protein